MAELSPRQREVLALRCQAMLAFEAIGGLLGISAGAARKGFCSTRKRLQDILQDWST
jgi:DNA-directed RNA polymerase specialized sigma24 family protein